MDPAAADALTSSIRTADSTMPITFVNFTVSLLASVQYPGRAVHGRWWQCVAVSGRISG